MEFRPKKVDYPFRKVSQELIDKILLAIKKGGTRRHSAEAYGITERHFYNLLSQGKVDLEIGQTDSLCARLVQSLRLIELEEIQECRTQVKLTPNGSQWTLEKVYWRDFGTNVEAKEIAREIEELKSNLKGIKDYGNIESGKKEQATQE